MKATSIVQDERVDKTIIHHHLLTS